MGHPRPTAEQPKNYAPRQRRPTGWKELESRTLVRRLISRQVTIPHLPAFRGVTPKQEVSSGELNQGWKVVLNTGKIYRLLI